jgi:hypothetical protein
MLHTQAQPDLQSMKKNTINETVQITAAPANYQTLD